MLVSNRITPSNNMEQRASVGANLPSPSFKWRIVTFLPTKADLWKLRESIGAIHGIENWEEIAEGITIVTLIEGLDKNTRDEIQTYSGSDLFDYGMLVYGISGYAPGADFDGGLLTEAARRNVIKSTRMRYSNTSGNLVFFVDLDYRIRGPSTLTRLSELLGSEKEFLTINDRGRFSAELASGIYQGSGESVLVDEDSRRTRGLLVSTNFEFITSESAKRDQLRCFIKFRVGLLDRWRSWNPPQSDILGYRPTKDKDLTRIALLVPTKSSNGKSPFLQYLLPTLAKTITDDEATCTLFTVYLGHDPGDELVVIRRHEFEEQAKELIDNKPIQIILQPMPPTRCVTMYWNVLATAAYHHGQEYFYQLNDDLTLETTGWSGAFTQAMKERGDRGVISPNDLAWSCRLFTQSFVSRKHYEAFGWYFPPEIKDWYSDNWITEIYRRSNLGICLSNYKVRNSNVAVRYNPCRVCPWKEAIARDARTIKNLQ